VQIIEREGAISFGDLPLEFQACVVMEGEVFWKVKWQPF